MTDRHGLMILPQMPRILRGYLIRLTHEYMDGGMDSHAEEGKLCYVSMLEVTAIKLSKLIFSANVRSAVRVFTGEAGETFAL
jgi:hypothetical protein